MPKVMSSSGGNSRKSSRSAKKDEAPSKKGRKTTGKGWGAVEAKKKANEEAREQSKKLLKDFFILDGESAMIQFLHDEPYSLEVHSVRNSKGKFDTIPCQLATQSYCLLCQSGKSKATWRAAFKVLDYRGDWDKENKEFKHDKPIEKKYLMSQTVAIQWRKLAEKKAGGSLSKLVWEITRTGSGPQDTTYTMEVARDDEDEKIKPKKFSSETPDIEELCKPLNDAQLAKRGFGGGDNEDDTNDDIEDDLPFN